VERKLTEAGSGGGAKAVGLRVRGKDRGDRKACGTGEAGEFVNVDDAEVSIHLQK
jgi:hypothetical protein